jgi:hypothetical protein
MSQIFMSKALLLVHENGSFFKKRIWSKEAFMMMTCSLTGPIKFYGSVE